MSPPEAVHETSDASNLTVPPVWVRVMPDSALEFWVYPKAEAIWFVVAYNGRLGFSQQMRKHETNVLP